MTKKDAMSADANYFKEQMMTRQEAQFENIMSIMGEYSDSGQRLGQLLLNVASTDPVLGARYEQILANYAKNPNSKEGYREGATFTWLWDIKDEEWDQAFKRWRNEHDMERNTNEGR